MNRKPFVIGLASMLFLLGAVLPQSNPIGEIESLEPLPHGTVDDGGHRLAAEGQIQQETDVLEWQAEVLFHEFPVDLREVRTKGLRSTFGGLTVAEGAREASFQSAIIETPLAFVALGTKWKAWIPTGSAIEIRVRGSRDKVAWTPWRSVAIDNDITKKDSGTFTGSLIDFARGTRFLQYSLTLTASSGALPELRGLAFHLIDPGKTPSKVLRQIEQLRNEPAEAVAKPPIVSRTNWGCPDGQSSPLWSPTYTTVSHLIVHHTDTTNTSTDWPAQVRSIWNYHTYGNDWGDIGYNYLVDPNGAIYEGRAGGDNSVGAHFSCQNSKTMGVALLGTYSSTSPTQAALTSLKKLLAWKCDQRSINPLQTSYHPGTQLTLYNISGHRDGNPSVTTCSDTVCPGNTLYNLLPSIRTDVNALITGGSKPDLVTTALSGPSTGTIGSTINISSNIANQGSVSAGAFRLGIYFSTNSTISTGDVLFALCNFSSGLLSGGTGTCSGPATVPTSLSPGTYYLGAIVDDQQAVDEANELNNSRVADSGTIAITSGCSYALSPSSKSFGSSGGSSSFSVSTQSGCSWSATDDSTWITVTSGSGTGSGSVSFSVGANSSTSSRTGHISVGGQTFTVSQSGTSCSYSISPPSQSFGSGGGSSVFSVTTQSGCSWSATDDSTWITVTSGSGTGSGTVSFSVSSNSSASSRTGYISVGGQTFTVNQAGSSSQPGATPADFDGDGVSDWFIYRGGSWLYFGPGPSGSLSVWTGAPGPGCISAPADYDGDGNVDFSQKCGGVWYFYNDNGSVLKGIWTGGVAGDLPVPADYDGDGDADIVIYRNGSWQFYDYATGASMGGVWTGPGPSAVPLPMDYDGDGRAEFSTYQNGAWIFYNDNGSALKGIWTGGVSGDVPVPGDYNGDGAEEPVIFRGGAWITFNFATGAASGVWTGVAGTLQPAPLDYDGDGTLDFTVYASGAWHFFSDAGAHLWGIWTGGVTGDRPISRRQHY